MVRHPTSDHRAQFHSFPVVGDDPLMMLTGPIPATHGILERPATHSARPVPACSGTLLSHLEPTGGRYGLQTMSEGGGMANATIIERL